MLAFITKRGYYGYNMMCLLHSMCEGIMAVLVVLDGQHALSAILQFELTVHSSFVSCPQALML